MDRYRKLRPVPDRGTSPWETPDIAEPLGTPAPRAAPGAEGGDFWAQPRTPPAYTRNPVPQDARLCSFEPPVQPASPRTLRVGLVGPPNAGKSSIMNALIECPVSAVSPKVNTTREGLRGIRTLGGTQLVFLDVPGIIPSHQQQKIRELSRTAWRGFQECDLCLLVIDAVKRPTAEIFEVVRRICPLEDLGRREVRARLAQAEAPGEDPAPRIWLPSGPQADVARRAGPPVTLVLNKVDKASEFRWVKSREREFTSHGHFHRTFFTSALREQGMEKLLEYLLAQARPGPWEYPAELRTTLSYTQQIEHQVSKRLFKWYHSDLPYKVQQQTVGWTPRLDGTLRVEHELIVQDSVVARIVLGVRNSLVNRMRDQVSFILSKMWGVPVDLQIWVKPLKQRASAKDLAERGRRPALSARRPPSPHH